MTSDKNERDTFNSAYRLARRKKLIPDVVSNTLQDTGNMGREERPNFTLILRDYFTGYTDSRRKSDIWRGRRVNSQTEEEEEEDGPRAIGESLLVTNVLETEFLTLNKLPPHVQKQLLVRFDHRPYFTGWVVFVNVVIMIVTLATHNIAPVGYEDKLVTTQLLRHNLAYETVGYNQSTNFWIGPDYQSLIHLGAKYSPCMRSDREFDESIAADIAKEDKTGCCIRRDLNVCWQTDRTGCTSAFVNFREGVVCGLGREGCRDTAFNNASLWQGAYSTWPPCPLKRDYQDQLPDKPEFEHMTCEVSARPCCVGVQGQCVMLSQDECRFKKGFFHPNSSLCSQVRCVDHICGLSGFIFPDTPDQVYRALLPTFMHAGLLHLCLSIAFHLTLLRDTEKLVGWWRVACIYMVSGVGGTMVSSIFIPYQPEVGSSGAIYGILASHVMELLVNWGIYKNPWKELVKLLVLMGGLFLFGLFPWVDNFAHIGGFLFGILTSFVFLPHVNFSRTEKVAKGPLKMVCSAIIVVLFLVIFIAFYVIDIGTCEGCEYLNCIPGTKSFCQDSSMNLRPRIKP